MLSKDCDAEARTKLEMLTRVGSNFRVQFLSEQDQQLLAVVKQSTDVMEEGGRFCYAKLLAPFDPGIDISAMQDRHHGTVGAVVQDPHNRSNIHPELLDSALEWLKVINPALRSCFYMYEVSTAVREKFAAPPY